MMLMSRHYIFKNGKLTLTKPKSLKMKEISLKHLKYLNCLNDL